MRAIYALAALAAGTAATPAAAFSAPIKCKDSHEFGQAYKLMQPAIFPAMPIRIEVEIEGGVERIVHAPRSVLARLQANHAQQFGSERPVGYVEAIMRRRPGVERVQDKDYRQTDRVTPPDGRYVVLALLDRRRMTPSTAEQARDCENDFKPNRSEFDQVGALLVHQKCDGSCSQVSTESLIDRVYGPPRTLSFFVGGRRSFHLGAAPGDRNARSFAVLGNHLDPDRIAVSRTGSEGRPFHPERFAVTGTVREMRPEILDKWYRAPLVTETSSITPCPLSDSQQECAPEESSSRINRVMGYPEGGWFGTSYSLKAASPAERAAACTPKEECLQLYYDEYQSSLGWMKKFILPIAGLLAVGAILGMRRRRRRA